MQATKFLSAAAALAIVAAPVFAATTVKDVNVNIDLEAIGNPAAAEYWSSAADDLENAIVARVTDRIADEGATVNVDINELELANSFQTALNVAESKLAGKVNVSHDSDNTKFDSYELTVTFDDATLFMPEGADLTAIASDSKDYYSAMINAFADRVAKKLQE